MTTQDIYTLANELAEKEIQNVLNGWEKDQDTKQIETFNSLVNLGDSRSLALASTIANKYNSKKEYKMYFNAYCI